MVDLIHPSFPKALAGGIVNLQEHPANNLPKPTMEFWGNTITPISRPPGLRGNNVLTAPGD